MGGSPGLWGVFCKSFLCALTVLFCIIEPPTGKTDLGPSCVDPRSPDRGSLTPVTPTLISFLDCFLFFLVRIPGLCFGHENSNLGTGPCLSSSERVFRCFQACPTAQRQYFGERMSDESTCSMILRHVRRWGLSGTSLFSEMLLALPLIGQRPPTPPRVGYFHFLWLQLLMAFLLALLSAMCTVNPSGLSTGELKCGKECKKTEENLT